MSFRMHAAIAAAVLTLCAGGTFAADKKEAPQAATPSPGQTSGYGVKLGGFFTDEHKQVAKRYFAKAAQGKSCPEGMQRDGKGCKPPVEGRYWAVGQPLQSKVETFALPDALSTQLPKAPDGYEYRRAGEDILLVSKGGLHLVVDIIEDATG